MRWKFTPHPLTVAFVFPVLVGAALTSCATQRQISGAADSNAHVVRGDRVPFFTSDPSREIDTQFAWAASQPPGGTAGDFSGIRTPRETAPLAFLDNEQPIRVLKSGGEYAQVQLDDGRRGFVSVASLEKPKPPLIAQSEVKKREKIEPSKLQEINNASPLPESTADEQGASSFRDDPIP